MDDKVNALDKLIYAVDAGNMPMDGSSYKLFGDGWMHVFDAYHGSLDAALSLHEALLPGQDWCIAPSASYAGNGFTAKSSTPARAWLLSILRAYRSVQA